jgi:uncharacterized membrane protein YphA (DoxX/SURF4 family)
VTRARPWIGLVARLVVAGTLLVAGGIKAMDTSASVRAVTAYELLPVPLAEVVGYALPWVEIALALLLLAGIMTRFAATASLALFVVFVVGIGSAWARGLSIDCGCFGGGGQVASDQTAYLSEIVRDVLLIAVAAWLVRWPVTRFAVDSDTAAFEPVPAFEESRP